MFMCRQGVNIFQLPIFRIMPKLDYRYLQLLKYTLLIACYVTTSLRCKLLPVCRAEIYNYGMVNCVTLHKLFNLIIREISFAVSARLDTCTIEKLNLYYLRVNITGKRLKENSRPVTKYMLTSQSSCMKQDRTEGPACLRKTWKITFWRAQWTRKLEGNNLANFQKIILVKKIVIVKLSRVLTTNCNLLFTASPKVKTLKHKCKRIVRTLQMLKDVDIIGWGGIINRDYLVVSSKFGFTSITWRTYRFRKVARKQCLWKSSQRRITHSLTKLIQSFPYVIELNLQPKSKQSDEKDLQLSAVLEFSHGYTNRSTWKRAQHLPHVTHDLIRWSSDHRL